MEAEVERETSGQGEVEGVLPLGLRPDEEMVLDDVTHVDERCFDAYRVPDPLELPTHKRIVIDAAAELPTRKCVELPSVDVDMSTGPGVEPEPSPEPAPAFPIRLLAAVVAIFVVVDLAAIAVALTLFSRLPSWAAVSILTAPLLGLATALLVVCRRPKAAIAATEAP